MILRLYIDLLLVKANILMYSVLLICFLFTPLTAHTTTQIPEILIIDSDTISIAEYPLNLMLMSDTNLLSRGRDMDALGKGQFCISSGCWRGYIGTWILNGDSLFLHALHSACNLTDSVFREFDIKKMFPGQVTSRGVFAHWVNDTLNTDCLRDWYGSNNCDEIGFAISKGVLINVFYKPNFDTSILPGNTDFQNESVKVDMNSYLFIIVLLSLAFLLILFYRKI